MTTAQEAEALRARITDAPTVDDATEALKVALAEADDLADGEAVDAYNDLSAAVHVYLQRVA